MGLQDLKYQEDYRSGHDNILDDFFRASLREATEYWRAVGYFSSSALEAFGAPLKEFVKKGGSIRLVTSVELLPEDIKAIERGLSKREICQKRIEEIIDEEFSGEVGDGVVMLGVLLEVGRLDIQVAIPISGRGIYHEKVGIFWDSADYVAFAGSSNESQAAFESNYECVDVYTSWSSLPRAERKRRHFEQLWNRTAAGVEVFSFPDAAAQKLLRATSHARNKRSQPTGNNKWRHQDEAVQRFIKAERGILNMATGTGKTRTATMIMQELYRQERIDTVIISTDGTDLLDQWYTKILDLQDAIRQTPLVYRQYGTHKELLEFSLDTFSAILICSRYALPEVLRQLSTRDAGRTLLVHDEVHRLGSPKNRQELSGLSNYICFRLGLSATPEREYDDEGNRFIEEHIGPELMSFGLGDAIERGILAPFNYYPLDYEISGEDRQRIQQAFARHARRKAEGLAVSPEDLWIDISRIYKTSRQKIPVFHDFISTHQDFLRRCIIFVETVDYAEEILQIVHAYRPDFHTYFSGEDSETLQRFAYGELECLITCHRLSEGIDIQSLNTVILFASARARLETVQRIGRCLRIDPENPDKVANVVDFIRESDILDKPDTDSERRAWLTDLSKINPRKVPNGS